MSTSGTQQYCLRWNNHSSNFVTVFDELLRTEAFTDVTIIAVDGYSLRCHKMVLAACSTYFEDLFIKNINCDHPVVILNDVKLSEIRAILDYMYRGEVNVDQDELGSLLKTAACLKIKGLVDDSVPCEEPKKAEKVEEDEFLTPPPSNSTSTSSTALSSGYLTPPPIPNATFVPYGNIPVEQNHNHPASWSAFPGQPTLQQDNVQGQHSQVSSSHVSRSATRRKLSGSYERSTESSPLSRKKLSSIVHQSRDSQILRNVLHHGQPDSHTPEPMHRKSNGSAHDRGNSTDNADSPMDEDKKPPVNHTASNSRSGNPKPEWKRYKQYTREHIQDAMNAVRTKQMSALQAARLYGVPSRTLYDKLKKAGIIAKKNDGVKRRNSSSHCSSARFPYTSSALNGSIYGTNLGAAAAAVSESESETSGLGSMSVSEINGLGSMSIGDTSYGIVRSLHRHQRESASLSPVPVSINPVAALAAAAAAHAAAAAAAAAASGAAEDSVINMSTPRTPSPAHQHPTNGYNRLKIKIEDDDQVEDLSMSRASGCTVGSSVNGRSSVSPGVSLSPEPAPAPGPLIPASSAAVKQEENEESNDGSTHT